jgi:hypothetical protein
MLGLSTDPSLYEVEHPFLHQKLLDVSISTCACKSHNEVIGTVHSRHLLGIRDLLGTSPYRTETLALSCNPPPDPTPNRRDREQITW